MKKIKTPDNSFRSNVLDIVFAPHYTPLQADGLMKKLKVRGSVKKQAAAFLDAMVLNRDVVKDKDGRFLPGDSGRFVTGILRVFRSGSGIVEAGEGGEDVFIRKEDMKNSLPGDRVLVDVLRPAGEGGEDRALGRVIRIMARSKRALTGVVKLVRNSYHIVPMDSSYSRSFSVDDLKGAAVDDRVVVQFSDWSDDDTHPSAEIIEVIGSQHDPSFDTLAAIRHFDLPEKFPRSVIREAEEAAALLDQPGERADFRDKFIFTIDPASARDFDDAISLEKTSDGKQLLGVHIADVSHFIKEDGLLDREARKRGNSVYLPDMVIPMLPEHISNGLCSLRPDEDRLAFSVMMTVDSKGVVEKAEFKKSIICSKLRLNYEEALAVLEPSSKKQNAKSGLDRGTLSLIRNVGALAQQMRQRRFDALALDLDVPDYEIVIGKDGLILEIKKILNDVSHQLIEECMIAANEAVDRELSKRGYTTLRRVHEPPTKKRIDDLKAVLTEMGVKAGDLTKRRNLVSFLKSIKGHPLEYFITIAVLKSMKRAEYSPVPAGHFGLAKTFYAHFTSPIRRYPDLVTHRILMAALERGGNPYPEYKLVSLGRWCSMTEQIAEQAEQAIVEIKKYRYLEQRLKAGDSDVYDGVVVSILNFGAFIELEGIQVQGLLRFSGRSGARVIQAKGRKAIMFGRQRLGMGSTLKVIVAAVDAEKKRIDLSLAEESGRRNQPAHAKGKTKKSCAPCKIRL